MIILTYWILDVYFAVPNHGSSTYKEKCFAEIDLVYRRAVSNVLYLT
jgi:hypothetical protein